MSGKAKGAVLADRRERFVTEYIIDLNATQAAIRAGYSAKTAYSAGQRLLRNVEIQKAVQVAKEARAEKTGLTAERVLAELELLAFSDHTHYQVSDIGGVSLANDAPPGAHRAISSIKHRIRTDDDGQVTRDVEIKLWDKPGMVRLAGRHLGVAGFVDKLELTGKNGGPIETTGTMTSAERRTRLRELRELAAKRLAARNDGSGDKRS